MPDIISDVMGGDSVKVADRLRRLCSVREYCSSEIMKKALAALDGDAAAAEEVVGTLIMEKYIDDLRYASAFARDKSSIAGWGNVKIRHMLASKGIQADVIAAALKEIDGGKAADRLSRVLETKARSLKDDPQARLKLIRFALGRGYEYDEIKDVLAQVQDGR